MRYSAVINFRRHKLTYMSNVDTRTVRVNKMNVTVKYLLFTLFISRQRLTNAHLSDNQTICRQIHVLQNLSNNNNTK